MCCTVVWSGFVFSRWGTSLCVDGAKARGGAKEQGGTFGGGICGFACVFCIGALLSALTAPRLPAGSSVRCGAGKRASANSPGLGFHFSSLKKILLLARKLGSCACSWAHCCCCIAHSSGRLLDLAPDDGQAPPRGTKKRHNKTRPRRAIGKRPLAPGCGLARRRRVLWRFYVPPGGARPPSGARSRRRPLGCSIHHHKAAQPRSSEKNAASRAGQTPCTR